MTGSQYTYNRLDVTKDAFRLVRLIRGYQLEPVRCELIQTYLHDVESLPYEALSYTWEGQPRSVDITVSEDTLTDIEGQRKLVTSRQGMLVTPNLHDALVSMRRSDGDRLLWIDAICIDHGNHEEKTHQVGQMRHIYTGATSVLIWLTGNNLDVDVLMKTMKNLHRRVIARLDYRRNSTRAWEREWPYVLYNSAGSPEKLIEQLRRALDHLLSNSWFRRVWILQEVACARSANIICGRRSISTRTFVVMPLLIQMASISPHVQAVLDVMPGYLQLRSWWSQKPDIRTLLKKFAACEASFVQDKMYALFGISSDLSENSVIPPDYDITMSKAIQRMILYLLFKEDFDDLMFYNFQHDIPDWSFGTLVECLDETPAHVLEWALRHGNEELALMLLDKGDIDITTLRTSQGDHFLSLAARHPHEKLFEIILNRYQAAGCHIGFVTKEGETLLSLAAAFGHDAIVKLLLANDADVNHRNHVGHTPLMLAILNNNDTTTELLRAHGNIDMNQAGADGQKMLAWAARKHDETLVKSLLEMEIFDVGFLDKHGHTALKFAVQSGSSALLKIFLEHGFVRPDLGDEGTALLSLAAKYFNFATFHTLLAFYGITVHKPDDLVLVSFSLDEFTSEDDKYQVAHYLLSCESLRSVWAGVHYRGLAEILIEHSVKVDSSDPDLNGNNLLRCLIQEGNIQLVKLLLEQGVDVNSRDESSGLTPLSCSAMESEEEIAQLLIEHGADPSIKDYNGRTPWEIASSRSHHGIAEILDAVSMTNEHVHK